MKARYRRWLWDLTAIAAVAGMIYGAIEYYEYAGPWKTLVMVPLMFVLGWLGVNVIYPLWYGHE
jgi:hypothetical protein